MFASLWLAVTTLPPSPTRDFVAEAVRDEIAERVRSPKHLHCYLCPQPFWGDATTLPPFDVPEPLLKDLLSAFGDPTGLRQLHVRTHAMTPAFARLRLVAAQVGFSEAAPGTQVLSFLSYDTVDAAAQLIEGNGADRVTYTLPLIDLLKSNACVTSGDEDEASAAQCTNELVHTYYVLSSVKPDADYFHDLHTQMFNDVYIGYTAEVHSVLQQGPFRRYTTSKDALQRRQRAVAILRLGFDIKCMPILESLLRFDGVLLDTLKRLQKSMATTNEKDELDAVAVLDLLCAFPIAGIEPSAFRGKKVDTSADADPSPISQWCAAAQRVGEKLFAGYGELDSNRSSPIRKDGNVALHQAIENAFHQGVHTYSAPTEGIQTKDPQGDRLSYPAHQHAIPNNSAALHDASNGAAGVSPLKRHVEGTPPPPQHHEAARRSSPQPTTAVGPSPLKQTSATVGTPPPTESSLREISTGFGAFGPASLKKHSTRDELSFPDASTFSISSLKLNGRQQHVFMSTIKSHSEHSSQRVTTLDEYDKGVAEAEDDLMEEIRRRRCGR